MKFLILFLLLTNLFAEDGNDGGNGGSGKDVRLIVIENEIERISDEIFFFFEENPEAQRIFPEIVFNEFLSLKDQLVIDIVDGVLIDKNNIQRTCLNFPTDFKIKCNLDFENLNDLPQAKYILIFHELLGLQGVEESNPTNPKLIQSYPVSSRLNRFLSSVHTITLTMNRSSSCELVEGFKDAQECLEEYLDEVNVNGTLIGDITWRTHNIERIYEDLRFFSPKIEILDQEFEYYGVLKDTVQSGYTYIGINEGENQTVTEIVTVSNELLSQMTEYSRGSLVEYHESISIYSLGLPEIMSFLYYDGL